MADHNSASPGQPPVSTTSAHLEIGPAHRHVTELRAGLHLARRSHLLTIFAGEDQLHLDLAGRLHRAWIDAVSYQRGLDGRVRRVNVDRRREGAGWLQIGLLERDTSQRLFAHVHTLAGEAARLLPSSAPSAVAGPLALAAGWEPERYAAEVARFARVYDPIPILPPDQNRALVLQATSGCAWNRCSFCHLYRDASFRVHPATEFRAHTRAVLELVGPALPLRRGLFLGQANALCIEHKRLLELIGVVREELGEPERWPLASFIDSFTRRRSRTELRQLAEHGLDSVALGLESGSAAVLDCLGKPAEATAAIELAWDLASAGIRRGIIVLVGAGGQQRASEHVEETVRTITAMNLERRDRVYLSPLHIHPDSDYQRRARRRGLEMITPTGLRAQAEELRSRLRGAGVRSAIARYDIRRFIY